jgi:hypothetical protein
VHAREAGVAGDQPQWHCDTLRAGHPREYIAAQAWQTERFADRFCLDRMIS